MNKSDLLLRDGHIHSPFCPHGSNDGLDLYVQEALKHNLKEISFTEHMDFPVIFIDDLDFFYDCAPTYEVLQEYFKEVKVIQEKYKNIIKINVGIEVDYLDGLEDEIKKKLNSYGDIIEDSLLSVHFVKLDNNEYVAIDGKDGFERAIKVLGSVKKVYDKYYSTLLKAIKSDLGEYKPKRIAHPNLITILNKLYPIEYDNYELLEEIAKEIKSRNYEVDFNTKGFRRENCKEAFVSGYFKELVKKYDIPIVLGSDAHSAQYVACDFSKVEI